MINFNDINFERQEYIGIKSFPKLTKIIGKIRLGELITIAARVGCGKTTLALNIFSDLAKKEKCLYISYEMNVEELTKKIKQFCKNPNKLNMWFEDDNTALTLNSLEKIIKNKKFKFIFIDYLQLMDGNIRKNTKKLKDICRKNNIVVFMLAQLNRKAESSEPKLSMLKDSGTIEQDSDEVWFIKEHSINVAKNRKGQIGEVYIEFDKNKSYIFESDSFLRERDDLIEEFNSKCCQYLDNELWESDITDFLEEFVLPYDKTLYEELIKKWKNIKK